MLDRRQPMSSWRAAAPLAMAMMLASPATPLGAHGVGPGSGGVAMRAVSTTIVVGDAMVGGTDGLRDDLRRAGLDMAAADAVASGRDHRLRLADARRFTGFAAATTDGAILSRMSRSLARWREGGVP